MNNFKKILCGVLAAVLMATALTACGGNTAENAGNTVPDGTGETEESLMADSRANYTCVSLSEELGITYDAGTAANSVTSAYTWVVNELVLNSSTKYKDPFNDVTLDLTLTNGTKTYTVPGFWDGSNTWRVRFVCTEAGQWTYETVCSDTTDTGLHGVKGTVNCVAYEGALDIYKHGFVTTSYGNKYFTYADGTPFFYLGDTHWSLGDEKLDLVKSMVKKRSEQGYTVVQSEPIGASFDVTDGKVSTADVKGFKDYDKKFQEIADKGLVHANASLFFTSYMETFISKNGGYSSTVVGTAYRTSGEGVGVYEMYDISDTAKANLEKICRYWVARYGAYPVMWTLSQECDNDYFWNVSSERHNEWSYVNNPYLYVANYIGQYDTYTHPLTAHQEGTSNTNASKSAFRDCKYHTWYASQWSLKKYNTGVDFEIPKDYWENGQGKPTVMYEGKYCYLWTKNFGARVQGWIAYMNGFYGCAYGAQDTWSYTNSYNESEDSNDGVDVITSDEKKKATYQDGLEYISSYQLGYMRSFLQNTVKDWQTLIPRFADTAYFTPEGDKVFYSVASNEANTKMVLYFYNFSDTSLGATVNAPGIDATKTGTVGSLTPNAEYVYLWFNPVTGEKVSSGTFTADANGSWVIGTKAATDMTLYICKK